MIPDGTSGNAHIIILAHGSVLGNTHFVYLPCRLLLELFNPAALIPGNSPQFHKLAFQIPDLLVNFTIR